MTIYLLDKNIVEDIRSSLAGNGSQHVRMARSIDRKFNFVSPLLACLEGSDQRPPSESELRGSLMRDSQVIGKFYHLARTDTAHLQDVSAEISATMGTHMREKANDLLPLALELQTLLSRTYSVADAWTVLAEIDARANAHNVDVNHPLIGCAVARLYGLVGAMNVFKSAVSPSERISYNFIHDIRMLVELAYIQQLVNEREPRQLVKLLTRDKGLNELAGLLKVTVVEQPSLPGHFGHDKVRYGSQLPDKLFPNLLQRPSELQRVRDYLKQTRTPSVESLT